MNIYGIIIIIRMSDDKIYNPKTGRFVNKSGKIGKELLKKIDTKKKEVKDPFNKKFIGVCDTGMVSETKQDIKLIEFLNLIGEMGDIYCVAIGNKNLASLDFSSYGKKKIKMGLELKTINNIIEFCNSKGIEYIHNTKNGGVYLKSVFFLPHNYNNALKLMTILWYPEDTFIKTNTDYQIAIGILLGYLYENIIYFLKKSYSTEIKLTEVLDIKNKLINMDVKLQDIQYKYKIIHRKSIELL